MRYRFYTVDAFTDRTFEGAQIAVLPDARGLNDTLMQKIAREFNVSETVFVLPAMSKSHARRLRIFTPLAEVPFAGHPTLAAAHVLTTIGEIQGTEEYAEEDKGLLTFAFEENVGPVNISVQTREDGTRMCEFSLSSTYMIDRFAPSDAELAHIFGLDEADFEVPGFSPMLVACDLPYLFIPVRSLSAVTRAKFHHEAWSASSAPATLSHRAMLFSTETESPDHDFHCRLLGPEVGVNEDPPIGSAIPAFSGYLCEMGGPEHAYAAERGSGRARRSLLRVRAEKAAERCVSVRVGGTAVLVCEGHLHIPG